MAVENFIRTFLCNVLSELLKRLGGATGTHKGTADDHVVLARLHVIEPILQLKNLVTVSALYSDLVNDIVQVSVLLLGLEWILALAAP